MPGDPPPERTPMAPDLSRQRDPRRPTPVDVGRVYEEAVAQEMKLKPRIQTQPKFELQTARLHQKNGNARVQRLDELALEQKAYVEEVSMKSSRRTKKVTKHRPKSSFALQSKRPPKVFPSQTSPVDESAWPSDPLESQKKCMSRARAPVIYPTEKELTGVQFWKAKRGNRCSPLDIIHPGEEL
jgi:hypothetical protein